MADQQVTTTRGSHLTSSVLKESAIQDFKAGLRGRSSGLQTPAMTRRARSGTA